VSSRSSPAASTIRSPRLPPVGIAERRSHHDGGPPWRCEPCLKQLKQSPACPTPT
jgi:hypothetical protein